MQLDLTKPPVTLSIKERISLYHRIFNTEDGRLLCEDLALVSGFYQGVSPSADSSSVMFAQGARHMFLYICSQIQAVWLDDESTPKTNEGDTIPWKM